MTVASTAMSDAPGAEGEPEVITGSGEQLLHLLAEAAAIERFLVGQPFNSSDHNSFTLLS